jgi:hypothetical protein
VQAVTRHREGAAFWLLAAAEIVLIVAAAAGIG